jgi:hypothetical protein
MNNFSQLFSAAREGRPDEVKALLRDNPDLVFAKDAFGMTLLHHAAYKGYRAVAELLLANNAEVNAKDNIGQTPLHMASEKGYITVVEVLLANKADVHAKDNTGQVPWRLAANRGYQNIAELLLGSSADDHAKSGIVEKLLHLTAETDYSSRFMVTITVVTDSATHLYRQHAPERATPHQIDSAVAQAVSALRDDILQGEIPKEAKATFETKGGNAKPRVREGSLVKCASRYPVLATLYTPVRRHARSGMGYGILGGILLNILLLGLLVYRTNQTAGAVIVAQVVACGVVFLKFNLNVNVPNILLTPCMLAIAFVIPGYLALNGLFPAQIGAAFSGGLLWCMPGMTIGAIVGTIRRPRLQRAHDAPHENALLWVAIPMVVSIVLWVGYALLARRYLPGMLASGGWPW